jgi:hypothetical protein
MAPNSNSAIAVRSMLFSHASKFRQFIGRLSNGRRGAARLPMKP